MTIPRLIPALLGLAATTALFPQTALAEPRLISADPADLAHLAKVDHLALRFSEKIDAALSGFELVMTAMPGMDHHGAMRMNGVQVAPAPDGAGLNAKLARALPAGTYELRWHAAGASGTAKGVVHFTTP